MIIKPSFELVLEFDNEECVNMLNLEILERWVLNLEILERWVSR